MADKEPDSHDKTCKVCGTTKLRRREGKYGRRNQGRTPRWVGEDGRLWNGLVCPDCHVKQTTVRQSIKRLAFHE